MSGEALSRYGRGMRSCCDSPAQDGQRHIVGCVHAFTPAGDDLVERATWLASGQDDPHSSTITELLARIIALEAERDALIAANDAIEIDAGLTQNGNLWRFWADKARKMVDRATTAEARIAVLEAQLERKQDLFDALVSFVHRWTWVKAGNGTTDAERLDAIKHYPPVAALAPEPS